MTKNPPQSRSAVATIAAFLIVASFASGAAFASPTVTERIEPGQIHLGNSAALTIEASGSNVPIAPPAIPGLEFVAVGQSSRFESINGQTSSTTSVTYQVTPQHPGVFRIPAAAPGSEPLELKVLPGDAGSAALQNGPAPSTLASAPMTGPTAATTRQTADGLTFVRLQWPKRQAYVGQSIPVEIQVGVRAGMEASLDGLPTLKGDAFTLGKLPEKPIQDEEVIRGTPFTVLTWRSVLVPIKSGALPLAIEAPLTVKVPGQPIALPESMDDDSLDSIFNDPFFQSAMRPTIERHVEASSAPANMDVLDLPLANRPADFRGAVGSFKVSSDLSASSTAEGDPLTLNLHVTGNGNFDRVDSPMLGAVDGWKTYPPAVTFTPADLAGDRGEKTFAQPVIATRAGTRSLPALRFSFFNPDTGHYETAQTAPKDVAVAPGPAGSATAGAMPTAAGGPVPNGMRPDQVEFGASVASLIPYYFQPRMLTIPALVLLGMAGMWIGLRRREQLAGDVARTRKRDAKLARQALLKQMDAAAASDNATQFFQAARMALQDMLAQRWHVLPQHITTADVDARLADNAEVRAVFARADEASYSGRGPVAPDFHQWKDIVIRQLNTGESP